MSYTGQCACGAVTATIAAEPILVRQCWCRQCQQMASGGPTNNAMFPVDAMRVSGSCASHSYVAASGNTLTQEFCATCGTPTFAYSSARPQIRAVRLGFLDEGHGLAPTAAIWTDDAPAWAHIDPALEQVARQPAPPPSS